MRMHRIMGQAGMHSRKLVIAAALMALAAMGMATSVSVAAANEFSVFAQCPTSTPGVEGCLVSRTESGEVVLGNK